MIPNAAVVVKGTEAATAGRRGAGGDAPTARVSRPRVERAGRPLRGHRRRFPGFESRTITDVRVRAGDNRREVTLAIEKVAESVAVGRDPATSASDPKSDRFSNVLSKDQIDALPDDPDEMEKVLKEMAGPGRDASAWTASAAASCRRSRRSDRSGSRSAMFAAENHSAGLTFVDIATQPGLGPLRGSMDFSFRDDSLNARNAFQPREGPRADAAVQLQPERHAAEGPHVVLARRRRRVALRLGERLRRGPRQARDRRRSAGRPIGSTSTCASITR